MGDVLGLYLVSQVDQTKVWVDSQRHTFHHAGVSIGEAEVGGEDQ